MKNYKKCIQYFIVIVTVLISLLPMMNYKAYMKTKDLKKLFNTDTIEQYFHYSVYKVFNKSYQFKKVIVGKDGMLFLGNDHNHILYKTQGLYKRKNHMKNIDIWTEKLKNMQEWYENRGIKFIIVVVPNKHTIHQDKLPKWSSLNDKTMTTYTTELADKKNIYMLDLKQSFSEQNSSTQLYLNTDTHWNNKGASLAFEKTIEFIRSKYNINYATPNYTLLETSQHSGDLARLLKIKYLLPKNHENNFKFKFEVNHEICHGNITKDYQLEKCIMRKNFIMDINNQAQYMINRQAYNDAKLLLLCDSFGAANSELYNMTFSSVLKLHYNHLYGEKLKAFVDKYRPDIVVYQVVERKLYEQSIVKNLETISVIAEDLNISLKKKIFDIHDSHFKYYKNDQFSIHNTAMHVIDKDPILILDKVQSKTNHVLVEYKIESDKDTKFQLFYKFKKEDEYHPNHSYIASIQKGKNTIRLLIPKKFINNQVRVDLVNTLGHYKVSDFSMYEIE